MTATANPNAGQPASPSAPCLCCDSTRQVLDIVGQPRPCSRCSKDEFDNWAAAKRAAEREGNQ